MYQSYSISSGNIRVDISFSLWSFELKVYIRYHWTGYADQDKYNMENLRDKVHEDFSDRFSDAIDAFKRKYKGYDNFWGNVNTSIS